MYSYMYGLCVLVAHKQLYLICRHKSARNVEEALNPTKPLDQTQHCVENQVNSYHTPCFWATQNTTKFIKFYKHPFS